jgi:hypothetical protein
MFDKKKSRPAGVRYQPIGTSAKAGDARSSPHPIQAGASDRSIRPNLGDGYRLVRRMRHDGTRPAVAKMRRCSCLVVIEHEQPYADVALLAVSIGAIDKIPQRCPAAPGDILQWRVHFGASDTGQ